MIELQGAQNEADFDNVVRFCVDSVSEQLSDNMVATGTGLAVLYLNHLRQMQMLTTLAER